MLKHLIACFFFVLLLVPILPVNGQDSIAATLWTPEDMLSQEEYYGIVIVEDRANSDITFDIVTDNEEVINVLTENVLIEKGKHHGIIKLETRGTGDAALYAVYKDVLLETKIRVEESAATPTQIDLILPTDLFRVLVDDNSNVGYVFLLNDFEDPVIAEEPIPITLTSNGEIQLVDNFVTIEPGQHYAKFAFEARGEGDITATGPDLELDEESISVDNTDEIELHIEVAPDPIPTYSSGEIYFWLERDGKPYIPTHDVKVTISIDKAANLSFDPAVRGSVVLTDQTIDDIDEVDSDARDVITRTESELSRNADREYIIKQGSYYGRLTAYSSFNEETDISVSGIAESINPPSDEETVSVTEIRQVRTEKSSFGIATDTKVFAYPDPAYKEVEIIVSSENGQGPVIERNDETVTVFSENELRLDSVSTAIKSDANYAIINAMVQDSGNVEIFAERSDTESDRIQIDLKDKYVKDPDLEIVPFPVIFGVEQDLFLVTSSLDTIKTENESEEDESNLISITSRPSFTYQVVREGESVLAVKGVIDKQLEKDPKIFIASNAFTTEEVLDVFNPERNKIETMHPPIVYPKEPFPLVNHVTDLESNVIRKADLRVSSSAEITMVNGLTYLNSTGKHGIIFYDKNSVPIESVIQVGASKNKSVQSIENKKPTIPTYEIIVENGQGSGTYQEGDEVTISAEPIIDDMFIIKKKLAGWEDLPYTEPTVTFEADDDIQTRPIYQTDYTILFAIVVAAAAIGAIFVIKSKMKKQDSGKKDEQSDEEKAIEEILKT